MEKIPVYFMPGLAASPSIFERIALPAETFEMILLEWRVPEDNESLHHYAGRIAKNITHKDPVLIGVSFGGILVQEIAKIIAARKVIIISSAKCNAEFPLRMKIAKRTRLYRLIPTTWLGKIENVGKLPLGGKVKERIHLYEKYLAMRDKKYLDWAIKNVIMWDRKAPDDSVIHIHGDDDAIFPPRYIRNFIPVKGGSHIMILNKYKWLNENLPKIILPEQ
ncbi:MAG TPA: alpha/beta hydrolase [Flavobacterium sp.]|jgi:pimeloyl-ACP methyl ester carboxylesterase